MARVLVIGGGGYVGSKLCPSLVAQGHKVAVYDTFWYGQHVLPHTVHKITGDIRDIQRLRPFIGRADAVIHLACISNDPSFDMNPEFGKSINLDCFPDFCKLIKEQDVKRFIYASSSSVYGIHEGTVVENSKCKPLTDYSRFKLACENHLRQADMGRTVWTIVRPATICGAAPRLRLDLIVNILTMSALRNQKIIVHGGNQLRPNLHINDMVMAYSQLLLASPELIHQEIFNVGGANLSVNQIAELVKKRIDDPEIQIVTEATKDQRSYHVNSDKFYYTLKTRPFYGLVDAIRELAEIYPYLHDPLNNSQFHNIKRMKELNLT